MSANVGTSRETTDPVAEGEQAFVENWGGLAGAFGMARDLGRVHALIYIALQPLDDVGVAGRLGLPIGEARRHLDELVDWGVVDLESSRYSTHIDPWVWFLKIVTERHRREFVPVLHGMRSTLEALNALDVHNPAAAELRSRAKRFTTFVEDLSRLIELFLRLGARPMAAVLRTVAKLAPRS